MYKLWNFYKKYGSFVDYIINLLIVFVFGMLAWCGISTLIHRYCYRIMDAQEWIIVPMMVGILYIGYRIGTYHRREVVMRIAYKHGYSAGLKAQVLHNNEIESEENEDGKVD